MGTTMVALADTVRRMQDGMQRGGVAGAFEAAQTAYADSASRSAAPDRPAADFNKGVILFVALIGAFLLWRGARRMTKFAAAVFWIWFATHGFRFG